MEKDRFSFKLYIPLFVMMILILVVIVSTTSFGFFEYLKKSNTTNKVSTANLIVQVDDTDSVSISNTNALPIYDEMGRKGKPYTFDLNNIGSVGVNYEVRLIDDKDAIKADDCGNIQMPKTSLKYQLIKNGIVINEKILSEGDFNVIDSGYIDAKTLYEYELRIWIHQDAGLEIMGKHFHGKIEVIVSDSTK